MRSREELGNVVGIVGQLTSMLSRLNVEEQIPRADILLDPELGELSGGDYSKALEFVAIGEAEARRHAEELSHYAVSEVEYAVYRSRHRFKPAPPSQIDFVDVVGNERVDRRVIETRVHIQAGDSLDPARIEEDVSAIHGLGDFTAVDWGFSDRRDQQGVVIRTHENPWGPNYLDFGMLFDVDGRFTGRINLTLTRLNARGAELRNDIQLGSIRSFETEFYQPLDFSGTFFVAPGLLLETEDQDLFDRDGNETAVYEVNRRQVVLDAGIQIGRLGEIRLGVVGGKTTADVSVGSPELPEADVGVGGLRGRLVLDRLDSASFPNRGYIASTDLFLSRGALGADDSYDRLEVRGAAFWPRGRKIWMVSGRVAGSLGSDLPAYDQPTVGGFLSLSGLERGQLRGSYAGVLRGGLLYRLSSGRFFVAKGVYVGGYAEAGNVWERSTEIGEELIYSGTMLFGIDSFLGPLYVAYGIADTGQDEFYVSLGQTF
jgi:NTE family protein